MTILSETKRSNLVKLDSGHRSGVPVNDMERVEGKLEESSF